VQIDMVSRVNETAIIASPIDEVWNVIRPVDFSFWANVQGCEVDHDGIRKVTFNDAVQRFRVTEISDQNYQITFELFESVPAVEYMSASHTWKLRRVTQNNSTFFEVETVYSSDATTARTEDSKYRKLDLFKELRAALANGAGKRVSTASVAQSVSKQEQKQCPPHGIPGSRQERSFIAVKPDGLQRGLVGEIIGRFEKRGFKLVAMKLVKPTKDFAAQHYADLKKKTILSWLGRIFLFWSCVRHGVGRKECHCDRKSHVGGHRS